MWQMDTIVPYIYYCIKALRMKLASQMWIELPLSYTTTAVAEKLIPLEQCLVNCSMAAN